MEQRVSLITLGCRDVPVAEAFYTALGWQKVETPEGIIVFDLIGQSIGLYPLTALAEDLGLPVAQLAHGAMTLGHNLRSRAEVDALIEKAREAGATILKDPQEVFWGGYHAYFSDPEGHIWEIAHNPGSELSTEGAFRWFGYGSD